MRLFQGEVSANEAHMHNAKFVYAYRTMFFIELVDLQGNQMVGSIPPELGLPKSLKRVHLNDNSFSCSSSNETDLAGGSQCQEDQLLPCFLRLSPDTVPRPDDSYMECPSVLRKSHDDAMRDCKGHGASQLVGNIELAALL